MRGEEITKESMKGRENTQKEMKRRRDRRKKRRREGGRRKNRKGKGERRISKMVMSVMASLSFQDYFFKSCICMCFYTSNAF